MPKDKLKKDKEKKPAFAENNNSKAIRLQRLFKFYQSPWFVIFGELYGIFSKSKKRKLAGLFLILFVIWDLSLIVHHVHELKSFIEIFQPLLGIFGIDLTHLAAPTPSHVPAVDTTALDPQ